MSRQRTLSIEALRVFAFLMVILIHVSPEYTIGGSDNTTALILQTISRAGFITFFIISGYFALNEKIKSITSFYYKRLVAILIPFLTYSYLHYFMVHNNFGMTSDLLKSAFSQETLSGYFTALISGPARNGSMFVSNHFWFVYWIIGMYLVTPLIGPAIQKIKPENAFNVIIGLVAINCSFLYLNRFTNFGDVIFIPHLDGWFLYFILGGVIRHLDPYKYKKQAYTLFVIGMLSTAAVTYANYNWWGINTAPYKDDLNMVISALSIFYIFNSINSNNITMRAAAFMAKYSYSMYLCHVFIYYYFNLTIKDLIHNAFLCSIVTAIIVFFTSLIVSIVIDTLITNRIVSLLKNRITSRAA